YHYNILKRGKNLLMQIIVEFWAKNGSNKNVMIKTSFLKK
ncbi:MAG: hypothetical protein ACJAVG_000884, partial [Rickettsiales bacterium]